MDTTYKKWTAELVGKQLDPVNSKVGIFDFVLTKEGQEPVRYSERMSRFDPEILRQKINQLETPFENAKHEAEQKTYIDDVMATLPLGIVDLNPPVTSTFIPGKNI